MKGHPQVQSYKLLFLSTPVGRLGTGMGGGVELTVLNIAQEMINRGHQLKIVAPTGSQMGNLPIIQIPGELQSTAQTQGRDALIELPKDSALANMWEYARQEQNQYDLIVNFAYDWLPFYLTPFFNTAIAHFVSMGSLNDAMDQIIEKTAIQFPGTIGVYTRSQAETFPFAEQCQCLGSGLDLSLYEFCEKPAEKLAWVARVAPEKALEDAVVAAQTTGIPLQILGVIQDQTYWQEICQKYPDAPIEYIGFFPTTEMQKHLRECRALIMTPRWVEAFGNVAIEALACGVPVISYRRGGPAEIVRDRETGFLVEPDSVEGLVSAIAQLNQIDRHACRQQAETEYSLSALGDRMEKWFSDIIQSH